MSRDGKTKPLRCARCKSPYWEKASNENLERMPTRDLGVKARVKADVSMHDADNKRKTCAHGKATGSICFECSGGYAK